MRAQTSLAVLNIGQAATIAVGVTSAMVLAGVRVAAGELTVGDFVLINLYIMQLYAPV